MDSGVFALSPFKPHPMFKCVMAAPPATHVDRWQSQQVFDVIRSDLPCTNELFKDADAVSFCSTSGQVADAAACLKLSGPVQFAAS